MRSWSLLKKLFRTGADRDNGILMSLLLLVAETMMNVVINEQIMILAQASLSPMY